MGLEGGETLATTVKKGSEEFSTIWWGLGSHSVSISTFCFDSESEADFSVLIS